MTSFSTAIANLRTEIQFYVAVRGFLEENGERLTWDEWKVGEKLMRLNQWQDWKDWLSLAIKQFIKISLDSVQRLN